jgi:DNA polymerase-3 subunit epsilon
MPYAVIDVETTGLLPWRRHRIVEIGVVHLDTAGSVTGQWGTLVNPQRSVGPEHVHGIHPADVLRAPTFTEVAADLLDLLRGRTLVGHNVSFDLSFLKDEFARAEYRLTPGIPSLCTMSIGESFGLAESTSLREACAHFEIDHVEAHTAGGDSLAAAELLAAYRSMSADWSGWAEYWDRVETAGHRYEYPTGRSPRAQWFPRAAS